MKTNLPGLALALALAASAPLPASASGVAPFDRPSLALPGEETPLGEGLALFAPGEPALTLLEAEGILACPTIHPSLAGDLCEVGSAPVESHPGGFSREALTMVIGSTTPEPNTAFLAALAGFFLCTARRRTIS